MTEILVQEEINNIKHEFYVQAELFAFNRSEIERQKALIRINGLLDEYWEITVEQAYTEGAGASL